MAFDDLLIQTCDIYRLIRGAKSFGIATNSYSKINTAPVPCRSDFTFKFESRDNVEVEEYIGRNSGVLFIKAVNGSEQIQARDIIVIVDSSSAANDLFDAVQFRVMYVNPALDGTGIHHLEAQIQFIDNPVELP